MVTLRTANDELARWLEPVDGVLVEVFGGDNGVDNLNSEFVSLLYPSFI